MGSNKDKFQELIETIKPASHENQFGNSIDAEHRLERAEEIKTHIERLMGVLHSVTIFSEPDKG
jgi:hypothetical protein